MVGELFNNLGYGIALQKSSPYTHSLSMAILELRENGFLLNLTKKWSTGSCKTDESSKKIYGQNGVMDMRGVFGIIAVAVVLSPLLVVIELVVTGIKHQSRVQGQAQDMKGAMAVLFSRFRRDFLYYSLPEASKYIMGLERYSRDKRETAWKEQALIWKEQAELVKTDSVFEVRHHNTPNLNEYRLSRFVKKVANAQRFIGNFRKRANIVSGTESPPVELEM